MSANKIHGNKTRNAKEKRESLLSRYVSLMGKDQASIVCGILAMNGSSDVCPLYQSISK